MRNYKKRILTRHQHK